MERVTPSQRPRPNGAPTGTGHYPFVLSTRHPRSMALGVRRRMCIRGGAPAALSSSPTSRMTAESNPSRLGYRVAPNRAGSLLWEHLGAVRIPLLGFGAGPSHQQVAHFEALVGPALQMSCAWFSGRRQRHAPRVS